MFAFDKNSCFATQRKSSKHTNVCDSGRFMIFPQRLCCAQSRRKTNPRRRGASERWMCVVASGSLLHGSVCSSAGNWVKITVCFHFIVSVNCVYIWNIFRHFDVNMQLSDLFTSFGCYFAAIYMHLFHKLTINTSAQHINPNERVDHERDSTSFASRCVKCVLSFASLWLNEAAACD